MKYLRFLPVILLLLVALGTAPTSAYAASTITVTTLTDDVISGNGCSLREAITNANNNAQTYSDCAAGSGSDTIAFSSSLNGTILLNSSLPDLSDSDGLSLNGGSAKVTINGGNTFRIFDIPAAVSVTIQNLTLAYGGENGGAIYNAGTLNLQSSTIYGGTATNGGAIYNDNAIASITNSTFTFNTADYGSVLYNEMGIVSITNSTIYDNTISNSGDGILYNNGVMTVKNTILANGHGASLCAGNALESASTNNLSDDSSCGSSFSSGTLDLGPLADNGGSTQTFSLLPLSDAINAANNSFCPSTDQRGTSRPQGTQCDIGSYEARVSLSISPASLAFGNQVVNITSAPKTVTITNTGDADITIGSISVTTAIAGEFATINDLCSGQTLIPTGTCTFSVTFTPTTPNSKTGTVIVPNNASTTSSTVSLTGTGYYGTNILLNPGFEYPFSRPIGWRFSPFTLKSLLDCSTGYNSRCSLRLPGRKRMVSVAQGLSSAGQAGTRFWIQLTSKAKNVSLPPDGVYQGEMIFRDYANHVTDDFPLVFTPGTHDWEKVQFLVTTTQDYYNFIFRISLKSNSGTAWFDNAIVVQLP